MTFVTTTIVLCFCIGISNVGLGNSFLSTSIPIRPNKYSYSSGFVTSRCQWSRHFDYNYRRMKMREFEYKLRKLNSRNTTTQNQAIMNDELDDGDGEGDSGEVPIDESGRTDENEDDEVGDVGDENVEDENVEDENVGGGEGHVANKNNNNKCVGIRIVLNKQMFEPFRENDEYDYIWGRSKGGKNKNKKSENFQVIDKFKYNFTDIGGFDKIKQELTQCVDFLKNYMKYKKFNVRLPKGVILEGPPGNGKTMLAKAFAAEAGISFIPVSGAEFQEKYVGVGASRIRELFKLAKQNIPCVIFIDEIDAVGRVRSGDGESSASERDSTLNELLVQLDGFNENSNGIFVIGATNRVDLLDPALIRPGRIDKRIYIGLPDKKTRREIIDIHIRGKPFDKTNNIVDMDTLVESTMGLSAAQIENLLNEAMLNALREDRFVMSMVDIDYILNRILAKWQSSEMELTDDILQHICVHEMGHAIMGLCMKKHSKLTKIIINLSSPTSPGYTIFEGTTSSIYTKETLFEHLNILLAGRIAEEIIYGRDSITTGAINDFEEATKLAHKYIAYYGFGENMIYPSTSEKYKQIADTEIFDLINKAQVLTKEVLSQYKNVIVAGAKILEIEKVLTADMLIEMMNAKPSTHHF